MANIIRDNNNDVSSSGGISNIVEDTTPQLGGDLDYNGHGIGTTGTPGTLKGLNDEIIKSSSGTLTATECSGGIINNYGQLVANTQTFPTGLKGFNGVCVISKSDAGSFALKANETNRIYLNGASLGVNGKAIILNPAIGNSLSFISFQTATEIYDYLITPGYGTTAISGIDSNIIINSMDTILLNQAIVTTTGIDLRIVNSDEEIIEGAADSGGFLFFDTFTDTDSTNLSDHTPDYDLVAGGWSATGGQITSNQAVSDNASVERVVVQTNEADVIVRCLLKTADTITYAVAIIARYVDDNNHLRLLLHPPSPTSPEGYEFKIGKVEGGSASDLVGLDTISAVVPLSSWFIAEFTLSSTNLSAVLKNKFGNQIGAGLSLSTTSSFSQTATKHGIYLRGSDYDEAFNHIIIEEAGNSRPVNGKIFNSTMVSANALYTVWKNEVNSTSKLYPKGLTGSPIGDVPQWTYSDTAADLYSSIVFMASILENSTISDSGSDIRTALTYEITNLSRVDSMPDDWNIDTDAFVNVSADMDRIIKGCGEYLRDGLLRITEINGTENPWYSRMISILDDCMEWADASNSGLPALHSDGLPYYHEVSGYFLQTLSRVYSITGTAKYLTWIEQIMDYLLLSNDGDYIPSRETSLVLMDHGGEIVQGMVEALYVECINGRTAKVLAYQPLVMEVLDKIVDIGLITSGDNTGKFYVEINPIAETVTDSDPIDTWGYIHGALYTYDLAMDAYDSSAARYTSTITSSLNSIASVDLVPDDYGYPDYISDSYADNIESMLMMASKLTVTGFEAWIKKTIGIGNTNGYHMFDEQKSTGFINGDYGDGSFGRTCVLFSNYITKGVRPEPWDEFLELSAEYYETTGLQIKIAHPGAWSGSLIFDYSRHSQNMKLDINYPRVNEYPEWFVVSSSNTYEVSINGGDPATINGSTLLSGLSISLESEMKTIIVVPN